MWCSQCFALGQMQSNILSTLCRKQRAPEGSKLGRGWHWHQQSPRKAAVSRDQLCAAQGKTWEREHLGRAGGEGRIKAHLKPCQWSVSSWAKIAAALSKGRRDRLGAACDYCSPLWQAQNLACARQVLTPKLPPQLPCVQLSGMYYNRDAVLQPLPRHQSS